MGILNFFRTKETKEKDAKEKAAAAEAAAEQELQGILGETISFARCCDCLTNEDQERFVKFCNAFKTNKTEATAFVQNLVLNFVRTRYNSGKMDELPPIEKWSPELRSKVLEDEGKSSSLLGVANLGSSERKDARLKEERDLARKKQDFVALSDRIFSSDRPGRDAYEQLKIKRKKLKEDLVFFNATEKVTSFSMLKLLMIAVTTGRVRNIDKAVEISKKALVDKNNRRVRLGLREPEQKSTAPQRPGGRAAE